MAYINGNQVLYNAQINGLVNIDSELSSESENPVQNKVITEALNNITVQESDFTLIQEVEVTEDEISSVEFDNISNYKKLRLIANIKVGSASSAVTAIAKFPNLSNFVNAYVSGAISTSKETNYQMQLEKNNGKWGGWYGSTTSTNQDATANVKTILNSLAFAEEDYSTGFQSLIFKSATSNVYLPIGTTVALWGVE